MRSRPSRTLLALTAVGALALAACGSDDDSPDATVGSVPAAPTAPTFEPTDTSVPTATDGTGPDETAEPDDTAVDGTDASGEAPAEADFVTAFGTNYAVFNDEAGNECVGQAIVDAVGFETIESSGIVPGDVVGVVVLSDLGLSIEPTALEPATVQLAGCGDLAAVALEGGSGTQEQTDCAAGVITSELAAEQLLSQIGELEPSAELAAARDALTACAEL